MMDRYYYKDTSTKTEKNHKYIKMPYELMKNELYKGLSSDAKILYTLMLDRTSLSQKKGYIDEKKRVYIYFSIESIKECLGCSKPTAIKTLKELEAVKLIEKKKQGQGKTTIIYVKKIEANTVEEKEDKQDQEQKKVQSETKIEKKKVVFFCLDKSKKFTCRSQKNVHQEVKKIESNKTKENYNKVNYYHSIYQDDEKIDRKNIQSYESLLKKQIEFDCLVHDFGIDKVQPLLDIMMDVLLTSKKEVAGINTELFRNRIWKLSMPHIQYVIWSMEKTTSKINNIYSYLAKTLYQATATQNYYYTTLLNYNMHGVEHVYS